MERLRLVGNFELIYEREMDMYRMKRTDSEKFSEWLNSGMAEELLAMDEDNFFIAAENLFLSSNN